MSDNGEAPTTRSDSKSLNGVEIFGTISTTQLLHLNDDCLDEMFGHLNLIDLCSVARVCKRFERLAQLQFKRKFTQIDFSKLLADRLVSIEEAKDVLRNFGPMIKSMTIPRLAVRNGDMVVLLKEGFLNYVAKYCGETLTMLGLHRFSFTSYGVNALNMLPKSLQALTLFACDLNEDFIFHFPALKLLRLQNVSIRSNRIFQHFVVTHKQLEELIIVGVEGIASDFFKFIGKYLKNLKHLALIGGFCWRVYEVMEHFNNNLLHLSELKNLQAFEWCFERGSMTDSLLGKILTNKTEMKALSFRHTTLDDETIKVIKTMKDLKILQFRHGDDLENQHLIEIAEELTQLKELYIGWQEDITFDVLKNVLCHTKQLHHLGIGSDAYPLDRKLYNDILDIVKKRQNGIKLTITIDSHDEENVIVQQTIDMNWLIVENNFCEKFSEESLESFEESL